MNTVTVSHGAPYQVLWLRPLDLYSKRERTQYGAPGLTWSREEAKDVITIKNLRREYLFDTFDVRVDRKSILGNPFYMSLESQRNYVCDKYEEYFQNQVENNAKFKKELDRLILLYKKHGELNLFCWCYPKRCHAETIKAYILKAVPDSTPENKPDNKSILQGELQNYRSEGWNIPNNYTSFEEYMLKSAWYMGLKELKE